MFGIRSIRRRSVYVTLVAAVLGAFAVVAALAASTGGADAASTQRPTSAQKAKPAQGNTGVDEITPAPGAFGADVPVTYQGPPPSSVKKELIGPLELLRAGETDLDKGTVTLPLYRGTVGGDPVWYILTDTSDPDEADSLGLNFSPKLKYADIEVGAREATLVEGNTLQFEGGTVDFGPERNVAPGKGADAFPPSVAEPGSRGSDDYSPLVKVTNTNTVYDAPIVSMASDEELRAMAQSGNIDHSKVHDKVVGIDYQERTVTLDLTTGFSFARPVLYLSTDANDPAVAALEGATFAPGLEDLTVGGDDGAFSSIERIFIAANGPTGIDNPQRQGLSSAIQDGKSPLNVLGGIPTIATDYSPLWDANLYAWTKKAIDRGYRSRNFEEFRILGLAQQGAHHRSGRRAVRVSRRDHQLPDCLPPPLTAPEGRGPPTPSRLRWASPDRGARARSCLPPEMILWFFGGGRNGVSLMSDRGLA